MGVITLKLMMRLMAFTTKDEQKKRLDICRSCDRIIKATMTCKECGCFMKVKTTLKTARCPKNKW